MKMTMNLATGKIVAPDMSQLDGFIGQESVIKKIKFFAISNSNETPFPTLLFTGSHGLGKTFLAEKVANMLGRNFISVNCGSIKKREDFILDVLYKIRYPTTIFLDESHGLSSEITTILLSLINPNENHTNILSCKDVDFVYDMSLINLIFATTDAHIMFRPLKNRCFPVYFQTYGKEELIDILKFYLNNASINCDLDDISGACRSRARDAYLLSQNIKRYLNLKNTKEVSEEGWNEIKNTFDIFPMGLSTEEVSLLEFIKDNGPISCSNLALMMMVNEDNIKSEIEVRLRELGFIENSTKGRQITEKGLQYFSQINSKMTV